MSETEQKKCIDQSVTRTIRTSTDTAGFWINSIGKIFFFKKLPWVVTSVSIDTLSKFVKTKTADGTAEYIEVKDSEHDFQVEATISPYHGNIDERILLDERALTVGKFLLR